MDTGTAAYTARLDAIAATLATRADIEMLLADMRRMSVVRRRWMIASLVGMFFGFVGLHIAARYLVEASPTMVASTAPQPAPLIVIYLPQPLHTSK